MIATPSGRDSPCGLGGSGGDLPGAREAPPSSSPSSGSSRARRLGPLGGGIAGLGPALAAHGSRLAPLGRPRSAPALRRAARAPALAAAAAQRDCLRPELPPAPPAGGAPSHWPPGTAPSLPHSARRPLALPALSPPGSAHPALPDPARECSEQSPITWVLGVPEPSKFGSKIFWSGENSYCLQHTQRNTYGFMSVPKKCKNCPALPSSSLPTVLGRYGAPPWKSVIPSSCLASASY